jgi:hypothetical protein
MARDLGFLKDGYPRTRIRSLWTMDRHEVTEEDGVYILLSGYGTIFTYPGGTSPVFYIGQSKNLRQRLQDHLRYANQIRDGRRYDRHYSASEYAAEFGCRYSCIPCLPGDKAKWLEADIMLRFEEQFRALPVACGSGSRDFGEWP